MALKLTKHIRLDEAALKSPNLTSRFTKEDLAAIADFCYEGYEKDLRSRVNWFKKTEAAMDLAMQVSSPKSFPWPNASNIVFPLVTIAALQFHSRAYPAIIQGSNVVRARVSALAAPEDIMKARSISQYMSYQVLEEDASWEEQHDRLLLNISIVGCAFKKSFYDPKLSHNVSQLVRARDLVVDYSAKSIEDARRKTQVLPIYRNDLIERCITGVYRDVTDEPWVKENARYTANAGTEREDKRAGTSPDDGDYAAPFRGLEQHCWLDLDGDGYEEPYIVLIEDGSRETLRIVSRVDRVEDIMKVGSRICGFRQTEYFTKYGFIPSPDGGIYDIGFGSLLSPLNESVNSLINQLVDAGTMANTAGGFLGRGAKVRGGVYSFSPMEWKRLDSPGDDIKKNIFPLPVREPSTVLFQLLSLLIDFTNRISGATEMLTGQNPGQNTKVGTTDQMVEQGLKIYSAIFKRVWRSMKDEFKKLYVLNALHLPTRKVTFSGQVVLREWFLDDPNHIVPYADPNIVSDRQRIQQAMTLAERARMVGGYNPEAVERNLLEALNIDTPEIFYPGVQKTGPLPNPKMMVEQEKTKREQLKLKHQAETHLLDIQELHALNEAKIEELAAQATKLLAEAQGVNTELQIQAINATVASIRSHNDILHDRARVILESLKSKEGESDNSGAVGHLVGGPGNTGAPPNPQGGGGLPQGGMGGGGIPA